MSAIDDQRIGWFAGEPVCLNRGVSRHYSGPPVKMQATVRSPVEGICVKSAGTITSINEISAVITDVNEIVATIATAVEEQSTATSEIASNINLIV